MRAHNQRRILWILDLALLLALFGLGAWYLLDVRGAVADTKYLNPAWAETAIREYEKQPLATQKRLRGPVSEEDKKEIDPPKFMKNRKRFHWPYSGPLPPQPPETAKVEVKKGPVITELEKLGEVLALLYMPPDEGEETANRTRVAWKFKTGKIVPLRCGEFIKKGKKKTNIKLVDVKSIGGGKFELHYEVYENPEDADAEPQGTGVYVYDGARKTDPKTLARLVRPRGSGTATAGSETGTGSAGVVERASGQPGADVVKTPAPIPATVEPEIKWKDFNNAQIEFNQETYDYFQKLDPEKAAKGIATEVRKDKATGKVLGLEITKLGKESPAQKFDVRPGDYLVSIDGKPVQSRSDAINIVNAMSKTTSRVSVVIDRNGRKITYVIDPRDPKTRRAARYLDDTK